ncbi:MAG TPA: FUSC family protein [Chthoniobacteraceae bacterium]|jgi:uncharacterized membrane protein YccC|nr:FUSC family protein [Chthoniobacteraceae bacterium]
MPDVSGGNTWRKFRDALTQFDRGKMDAARGLRNAVGVALPMALGAWLGRMQPALVVATGALNVGFADSTEPYLPRVRRMLAACALVTLAVFCGSLSGWTVAGALAAAALWTFGAGMLVSLGAQTGNMGVSCTCVLLVFASRPLSLRAATLAALLALGGGLIQTGLSVLLWPVRPYEPERQALAALYLGLARLCGLRKLDAQSPPGTTRANEATEALANRRGDHSTDSVRFRALLDQAERIRVYLLTLARVREQLEADDHSSAILDAYSDAAGHVLEDAAQMLHTGHAVDSNAVLEMETILDGFRKQNPQSSLHADVVTQMDALTRQLRIILGLAGHATPAGREAFARRESARFWSLRPGGALTTLRANLNFQSTTFRHAVRLSACVTAADAFGRVLGWPRPYWLPLTVMVVLKPDFSSTFTRGVLRLAGTFIGLGLATAAFHLLPRTDAVEIVLIMAATFILRWSGPAHYGILAMCVSELVVLLIALTGVEPGQVILARARNTALGGALALMAYWLWPTWERSQVGEIFARMLDAYRRHVTLISRAYGGEDLATAIDRSRNAARLARTNLEASVDRLAGEPATTPQERDQWSAMLAGAHIFSNSLITLHASLLASPGSLSTLGKSQPFKDFFHAIIDALEKLASALRGADPGAFPDLRAAHYRLVNCGEPLAARHALIGVETDKMVNALNTLREKIAALRQPG